MSLTWIGRMDRWLSANRPEYYSCLRPGAIDTALDAFDRRFFVRLPEIFRAVYRWRDGQHPTCSASLQNNLMFSSLAEIAEIKDMLDGMIGSDFDDPRWWRRGWVPFLSNGAGDHLCLDIHAEDGGEPGQLIAFRHDWDNRAVRYPSFGVWLEELVQSMENNTLEFL